jgi:hypothetical protein
MGEAFIRAVPSKSPGLGAMSENRLYVIYAPTPNR